MKKNLHFINFFKILSVIGTLFIGTMFSQKVFSQTTTLASASQVAASNVCAGSLKVPVYQFTLTSTATPNFTAITFTTTGTYVAADLVNFKLWGNTTNTLATATQIGANLTTGLGPAAHTISGYTYALAATIRYFWITVDVSATPVNNGTLTASAITTANITISAGTKTGTATAGGAQTLKSTVVPSVIISAVPVGAICTGTSVTFTATPTNGGTTPAYQWKLNGANVGTNSTTYTNAALANGNIVSCVLTSNAICASPITATSNIITMTVTAAAPASPGVITGSASVTASTAGLVYSIAAVAGATTYTWSVPAGWTITGGQGTISLTTTSGTIGQNGNISVTASNICGTGADAILAVTIIAPHDLCAQCHINHTSPGMQLTSVNGNANLCMNCHTAAGIASSLPFTNAMKAIPGTSGTSHAWDKTAVNATYETILPSTASMLSRISAGQIICSTCHDQHSETYAPFLRANNAGDAMCKDCHSPRNVGRYIDNTASNKGSHPVGLVYNGGVGSLNATPTAPLQTVSGKIECSSCHKTHYSTSTDGNILRATNNDALCTSCHNYGSHQGQGCKVCHDTHNPVKTNIYLIKDNVTTPNSGLKSVIFTAETGAGSFADGATPYNGICEVCHTLAASAYHLNNSPGTHNNGTDCTSCHPHSNNFTPIGCHNCHDSSLPNLYPATGAHAAHSGPPYNFKCETCHYQYGQGGALEPTHSSGTVNVVFKPTGLARRNGLDSNTPTWNSVAKTCSNVYCHSNGVTADRGSDGTYTWGNLPFGTIAYATTPSWDIGVINTCTPCHAGLGNMVSPYTMSSPGYNTPRPATGSHGTTAHTDNDQTFSGYGWTNVQCFWCHNANGAAPNGVNFQGTYGTVFHVDGQTHFKPIWYSSGGTFANGHAYAGNGAQAHCGVGKTCW